MARRRRLSVQLPYEGASWLASVGYVVLSKGVSAGVMLETSLLLEATTREHLLEWRQKRAGSVLDNDLNGCRMTAGLTEPANWGVSEVRLHGR